MSEARHHAATGDEAARISADNGPVQAWVIPTDEERQIARENYTLLSAAGA